MPVEIKLMKTNKMINNNNYNRGIKFTHRWKYGKTLIQIKGKYKYCRTKSQVIWFTKKRKLNNY